MPGMAQKIWVGRKTEKVSNNFLRFGLIGFQLHNEVTPRKNEFT